MESVESALSRKGPKKSADTAPGRKPHAEAQLASVDALAELAPFSKALASVATREEPERPDASPELVASAYILRATWLAFHRGDADAAELLHDMAKQAVGYLDKNDTRGIETTVCKMFALPPIKSLNRADAGRDLIAYAELALRRESTASNIAACMQHAIEGTFPNLLPSWKSSGSGPIANTIERDHRLGKLSPRKLAMLTLRALGMPDTEIASIMKASENRP